MIPLHELTRGHEIELYASNAKEGEKRERRKEQEDSGQKTVTAGSRAQTNI